MRRRGPIRKARHPRRQNRLLQGGRGRTRIGTLGVSAGPQCICTGDRNRIDVSSGSWLSHWAGLARRKAAERLDHFVV
jgi:hypothetical protein